MESAREPGLHWAFLSFYRAFVVKTGRQWSKNKRRQQRGREGWKRCRKRGDISLLSYGRVIAGVELCCRVLENHLLHRKVTASKMLAWRWRYVLWPRAEPGDGFLPIVFCCGVMLVPWWYCTSVPWVNLTRDHRYWPSWAAVSDMQKRSLRKYLLPFNVTEYCCHSERVVENHYNHTMLGNVVFGPTKLLKST